MFAIYYRPIWNEGLGCEGPNQSKTQTETMTAPRYAMLFIKVLGRIVRPAGLG